MLSDGKPGAELDFGTTQGKAKRTTVGGGADPGDVTEDLDQEANGAETAGSHTPTCSARCTNSGTDSARIFSITRPRWILMVVSVMPSSAAVCLFRNPRMT